MSKKNFVAKNSLKTYWSIEKKVGITWCICGRQWKQEITRIITDFLRLHDRAAVSFFAKATQLTEESICNWWEALRSKQISRLAQTSFAQIDLLYIWSERIME